MIHPTAIVHPNAEIGDNVEIGPYSVIGENVSIGAGTRIGPHVVIEDWTEIGEDNNIFQFASIGAPPQDLKFGGEKTTLKIGDRNMIRESVTMHRGTGDGGGQTIIGDDNLFMAYTHVAHDCRVGNHVIMANCATLAGHVEVDDYAILGGLSAYHQFVRIGCHVMISGGAIATQDVPPYVIAQGDRASTHGVNAIGLSRRGFSKEAVRAIKNAYKTIYRSDLRLEDALEQIMGESGDLPEVKVFIDFIKGSERGIIR
ncbi:MAG: acyl-[acyl-carrier-protein]--UDP-N-acetylglucosamine O-acyltransferase [Desulfuromonas sp.]|nr:MAG: acyl-[acyl-carrier-protein]--UDP-N-acetylglucosamine O-acyltransferase [Desulfuromonas sp.]